MTLFQLKICGITSWADAQAAAAAGADAIGLNFYPGGKRYVRPTTAAEIAGSLPPNVWRVGVFVNATAETIEAIAMEVGLDAVQLHGDEPPEMLAAIGSRTVIRAFRCRDSALAEERQYLLRCQAAGRMPDAVLIDAFSSAEYGGTGRTLDWSQVAAARNQLLDLPLVLAGGLRPGNVGQAIRQARPDAVDTASGVESSPGIKDLGLLRQFLEEAREAFRRAAS